MKVFWAGGRDRDVSLHIYMTKLEHTKIFRGSVTAPNLTSETSRMMSVSRLKQELKGGVLRSAKRSHNVSGQ
jgi:hypothetical protein